MPGKPGVFELQLVLSKLIGDVSCELQTRGARVPGRPSDYCSLHPLFGAGVWVCGGLGVVSSLGWWWVGGRGIL